MKYLSKQDNFMLLLKEELLEKKKNVRGKYSKLKKTAMQTTPL